MNTLRALSTRCLAVLLPAALAVGGAWAQVAAPAAPAQAAPASAAPAQTIPAHATTATMSPAVALPVRTLAPFDARYAVFRDGKPLGDASLQLVSLANARWRVDLHIEATHGLLGFAGIDLQQSTVFDVAGAHYRPLSQSTVRKAIFSRRMTTGVYDWSHHAARWTGDVKKTRRGEVPLREGDMSGLLINLAVLRDAAPGATLQYRFVDDGRARDQQYRVAPDRETQQVDDLSYAALRVDRVHSGADVTTLWVVEDVPMPIRILQRDDEGGTLELRLIDYREV